MNRTDRMYRYVIRFTKEGYIRYTSHLDMLRLFKRAFKRAGIALSFSQGFNPHPKMGFAQPLSLGYTSRCELLEFETAREEDAAAMAKALASMMPEGVEILSCRPLLADVKSLAAAVREASYKVVFPVAADSERDRKLTERYLAQTEILAEKRQKKTKKLVTVDIRPKIRDIRVLDGEQRLTLELRLDSGSASNLSPEQVIATFTAFAGLDAPRYDVEVERVAIEFDRNLQF